MPANGDSAAPARTAAFSTVQRWISRQQHYELSHKQPAPLTEPQRQALLSLELAIQPEPGPEPHPQPSTEPELGEENWIGKLHEYRAAYPDYSSSDGTALDFTEEPVQESPRLPQRWRAQVRICERATPFPGPESGLGPDSPPPSFARKKDARSYAAKCALEWLKANGHMPAHGSSVKFPKGTAGPRPQPPPSPPPREDSSGSVSGNVSDDGEPGPAPGFPSTLSQSDALEATPPGDPHKARSAYQKVSVLCKEMRIPPIHYRLDEEAAAPGFFRGYADFGIDTPRYPCDVGRVESVLGQVAAREQIAKQVLPFLQAEWKKREAEVRQVMGQGGEASAQSAAF